MYNCIISIIFRYKQSRRWKYMCVVWKCNTCAENTLGDNKCSCFSHHQRPLHVHNRSRMCAYLYKDSPKWKEQCKDILHKDYQKRPLKTRSSPDSEAPGLCSLFVRASKIRIKFKSRVRTVQKISFASCSAE